ncbi:MAG: hypothetical protein R2867_11300 [Caldilineaceae bacterium]
MAALPTQRMLQWHHKAVDPPGDCRKAILHFFYHLGQRLRKRYANSTDPKISRCKFDLGLSDQEARMPNPTPKKPFCEINGWTLADKQPVNGFTDLKDDGSTACGCWIYSGCYASNVNRAAQRKPGSEQDWVALEWGWAWPSNRRILYNRASADPEGKPWSERKRYVWWDEEKSKWTGYDTLTLLRTAPLLIVRKRSQRQRHVGGRWPFIMQGGWQRLAHAPNGLLDGPLPTL